MGPCRMTFDELYTTQYRTAICHAEIVCRLRDDYAEQIVLDAFFELHQALEKGLEIEHPAAIVCKQVRIQAALRVRRECRTRRGGERTQYSLRSKDLCVEHTGFAEVDAKDTVEKAWAQLSEMERKIATLVFMQSYSQPEAAGQLGMPLRTMQRNVRQLRSKLRELLM